MEFSQAVDCAHPYRISLSISYSQETFRLRKDLSKVVVLDVIFQPKKMSRSFWNFCRKP